MLCSKGTRNSISYNIKLVDRQFYYQDFMRFAKNQQKLQTSKQQSQNKRKLPCKNGGSSRQSNLKPSPTRLPAVILKNIDKQAGNDSLKQRRKLSNLFMPEEIVLEKIETSIRRSSLKEKSMGLSSQQHSLRKQNYLNTKYNIRMNHLVSITKENKHIYQRINSQKSLYSSKKFQKSYQSNSSLSRRLSQSKLSKISSKHSLEIRRKSIKKQLLALEGRDSNEINTDPKNRCTDQKQKVYRYMSIFCNRPSLKKSCTDKERPQQQYQTIMTKLDKQNKSNLPSPKIQPIHTMFSHRLKRTVIFNHIL